MNVLAPPHGPSTVRPTGIERPFSQHEIIVSKTDPQGRITYANDVFLRVSGYTEEQAMGAPQNIVRHPDMPRTIFDVMWETIGSGQEFFGYVLNMGVDGGHYWVLAHITPSSDQNGIFVGYHSNRRWVAPHVHERVAAVYRRIRDTEQRSTTKKDAITAGRGELTRILDEVGHTLSSWTWQVAATDPEVAK
jgi:PAS domain S-box-containing protein